MNILLRNFLVYGTGLSGTSAVSFLLEKGAMKVYTYDDKSGVELPNTTKLENLDNIDKLNLECVVLSPGIKVLDNANIEKIKKYGIKIVSEFMLGFLFSRGKKICITGTNGKTTTVNLLYNMLKSSFKSVFLCGNTDTPITKIANKTKNDSILVCEVSSFALESADLIKPTISSILNITEDHIARHKTFKNYRDTKLKITKWQTESDFFVCSDEFIVDTKAKVFRYSLTNKTNGVYVLKNHLMWKEKRILNTKIIKLKGENNLQNIMCAVTIAKILGVKNKKIKQTVKKFKSLKHRMEKVLTLNGVTYIDDSKATNPDSTICALKSFNKNVILLLGGSDKGYDYDCIFNHCHNVKEIVTFGEMGEKIKQTGIKNDFDSIVTLKKMKDATLYAMSVARDGDTVLLSPACASFDEFSSYKERGDRFVEIIKEQNEEN